MLETIRRHQKSWLTYFIFAAIIVVFAVNFGPGSSGCRTVVGPSNAASVDGDAIRRQDFAVRYRHQLEMLRDRFSGSNAEITDELVERMGLRRQVLDQMVHIKLLAHEAEKRGLEISDAELLDYLDKAFSVRDATPEQYRNFVASTFLSNVSQFERSMRQELLAQRMTAFLNDNVGVSDAELKIIYERDNDRAMIDYVRFDFPTDVAAATNEEIDHLLANESQAIEQRFSADAHLYTTAEQRKVRQLFIKLPEDAKDEVIAAARTKLAALKSRIAEGADFEAVAKENSAGETEKTEKIESSDLGWLERGIRAPALDDAIFALRLNEISEPVRTLDGMYLVQVTEIKPAIRRPLSEVERQVATTVLRDRAADTAAKLRAEALLVATEAGKSLEQLTGIAVDDKTSENAATALPVRRTSGWIKKGDRAITSIGFAPDLTSAVFSLTSDKPLPDRVFKVNSAYYVIKLVKRELPDLAQFEKEKSELRTQELRRKQRDVSDAWLRQLWDKSHVVLDPAMFGSASES